MFRKDLSVLQSKSIYKLVISTLLLWCLSLAAHASALGNEADTFSSGGEIPSAEQAFSVSAFADTPKQQVIVNFELLPHVYLYRHRFDFTIEDLNGNPLAQPQPQLPAGKAKQDEIFGQVEVYYKKLQIQLPLDAVPLVPAQLAITFQGCLEDTLCYPPVTRILPLEFTPATPASPVATAPTETPEQSGFLTTLRSQDAHSFNNWMSQHSLFMTILLFFAGGILLAFTPCVFPMIPILSSVIAGEQSPSARTGFILSLAYVLGMAIPYTLAGLLVAHFGAGLNLQYLLQQPIAIAISSLFFAVLSLSMFGLYQIQLPAFIRDRLQRTNEQISGGSFINAMIMGAVSALVVSPCVTPILAGALVYVANTGEAFTGAASLLSLSLGMGAPLIIFGATGGALLPKAGGWMDDVKHFFGVSLLLIAIWLLDRIIPAQISLALYGIVLAVYGVQLGALEPAGNTRLKRGIALVLALYGAVLLIGAASGGTDPLQPLHSAAPATPATQVTQTEETGQSQQIGIFTNIEGHDNLRQALKQAAREGKPVLVDFFAEWCVSCRIMEETTFQDPAVIQALGDFVVLRSDITDITTENREIMTAFDIVGLPSIHFYDPQGNEIPDSRIMGEMNASRFLQFMQENVQPSLNP